MDEERVPVGYFRDAAHVHELIGGLFERLRRHPEIGPKVRASGLLLRFNYTDPDAVITIDATKDPCDGGFISWHAGPPDRPADVEMSMKADVAHRFWLGQVNLLIALTRRDIVARGPIPKVLKLLPIISPAYPIYREVVAEHEAK